MADEAGKALRAGTQLPVGHDAGADCPIYADAEDIPRALAGARLHLAEGHHLRIASHPTWRAEAQRNLGWKIDAAPCFQDVEGRNAESLALVGVEQGDLRQRNPNRPHALLPAALVEKPDEQRGQPVENGFRAEREIGGLMVLDDQIPVEIRQSDRERRPIDVSGQNCAGVEAKPDAPRRAAAGGRAELALDDQAQPLQGRQTVGDNSATKLGMAFDVETSRRGARADQREDSRQASAATFQGARAADARSSGRGSTGFGVAIHLRPCHRLCRTRFWRRPGTISGGPLPRQYRD